MAEPVWDKDGILDGIVDAKTHGNVALTENSRTMQKWIKSGSVAEHIRFGSNISRAQPGDNTGAYRRAVTQSLNVRSMVIATGCMEVMQETLNFISVMTSMHEH